MKCKTCCVVGVILGKLWDIVKGFSVVLSVVITVVISIVCAAFLLGALSNYYVYNYLHWKADTNIYLNNLSIGFLILEIIFIIFVIGKILKEIYKYTKVSIDHLMIDIKNKCK